MKFIAVDSILSEVGRALWQWYSAETKGGVWPAKDAFRPEALPARVLPNLGVVDVEREPFRVCYRLVGSVIAQSLGRQHVQGYLDALALPQEEELLALYRHTVAENRPLFLSGQQQIDGQVFTYEGGALPLGAPADAVRRFIIFEGFPDTEAWRGAVRLRRYRPNTDQDV